MRRVMVIGCPGAGKSTLAVAVAKALDLPLIHLDRHYWRSGWAEPRQDEWREQVARLVDQSSWVMDGNYSATWDLRVPRAEAIVWLDLPRWLCLSRVFHRIWKHFGRVRADLAPGCPEQFDWEFVKFVWTFDSRNGDKTRQVLAALQPWQRAVVLRDRRAVAAFSAGLPASLTGAAA